MFNYYSYFISAVSTTDMLSPSTRKPTVVQQLPAELGKSVLPRSPEPVPSTSGLEKQSKFLKCFYFDSTN